MEKKIKKAIETYQCLGCVSGHNIKCFQPNEDGVGCGKHHPGTRASNIGLIFLGMPKGFNRVGPQEKLEINIFPSLGDQYNAFNVPTWKHLNANGHTIVRGMMPRRNQTFLHIFLENCIDKINCLEITDNEIDEMD